MNPKGTKRVSVYVNKERDQKLKELRATANFGASDLFGSLIDAAYEAVTGKHDVTIVLSAETRPTVFLRGTTRFKRGERE